MAARVTTIVLDAIDPERLSQFWSDVLGWQRQPIDGGADWIAIGDPKHEAPFILLFLPSSDEKRGKNRVHLDVNPVGCDQQQELDRLLSLGARHVDIGQGDQSWFVLADPEGNEFCLLHRRID
jgi:catechol-2,3-dioxygenase